MVYLEILAPSMDKLIQKVRAYGWKDGIGDIITLNPINTILHYGCVTVKKIWAKAILYMDNASRQTQNNDQMYSCIMNSLSNSCANKIINCLSEHTIQIGVHNFKAAILLHKVLMLRAVVDTRSTVPNLRTNLSSLSTYMPLVTSDIEKFNQYVIVCVKGLETCWKTLHDLLDNLFICYKRA